MEEISLASLSKKQVDKIRVMMVTPKRQQVMDDMGRMILGPKFGLKRFNYPPGFWYTVLRCHHTFQKEYGKEKELANCFDMLFGFTYHLSKHPRWLTHHGRAWGGEKMVANLGKNWKDLLKNSSTNQLGLDDEFSLPAAIFFLEEFKTTVESAEMYGDPKLKFNFT